MKVAAYTGGVRTPSARMRVRQYGPLFETYGIQLHEYTLSLGKSMPSNGWKRPWWAARTFAERCLSLPASYRADLTLISRHMLPGFIPMERWAAAPRVLDVDDAIWLNRGGHRAAALAAGCSLILCGNSFLAEYFSRWNRNIAVLPTGVDTTLVHPALLPTSACDAPVIGWTGTSGNFRYLYQIEEALRRVLSRHPRVRLCIVADTPPRFHQLDPSRLDFVRWSPETEREALRKFTIGIMPLEDTAWERGKCAFKMLLYMASGIPAVVSPVGMNRDLLGKGDLGLGASTLEEWTEALDLLLSSPDLAASMGTIGRNVAVQQFSIQSLAPVFARLLHSVAGTRTVPWVQTDAGVILDEQSEFKPIASEWRPRGK